MAYVFLLLQVLLASGFALGLKASILRRQDMLVVGGLNYVIAWLIGTPPLFVGSATSYGWAGGICGAVMGFTYFIAYFFYVYAMRHQGLAATAAFGQLSVLIPILFSVFLWREYPSIAQLVGILLAGAAMALLDARRDLLAGIPGRLRWFLAGFFLCVGTARLSAKVFTEAQVPDERAFYLWMVYACSGACSLVMLVGHKRLPTREEWLWGGVVGGCNIAHTLFLLLALERLPGIIVFPISACGTIVVIGAIVVAFFGERPTVRLYLGIATSAIAVALLNLRSPTQGS